MTSETETKLVEALRDLHATILKAFPELEKYPVMGNATEALREYDAAQSSGQTIPAREEDRELTLYERHELNCLRAQVQQKDYPCSPHCEGYLRELALRNELSRPHASHPEQANICPACNGSGEGSAGDCPCAECDGSGKRNCAINPIHPEQANAAESVTEIEGAYWEISGPRAYLNIPSPVPNYWRAELTYGKYLETKTVVGWGATEQEARRAAAALTMKGEKK